MARSKVIWLFVISLFLALSAASVPQAQDTRFHYLSPIDGTGTEADPFHSRCLTLAGKGNIDLRPFGIDAFWCASNSLPANMTGVIQLGNSLSDTLTGPRKAAFAALLGKAVVSSSVNDLLVEVLQSKLQPGADGKIKIFLGRGAPVYQKTAWVPFEDGGLVADITNYAKDLLEPAIAWAATSASENWNCTNATGNITCQLTWNAITNLAQMDIASNAMFTDGNFTTSAYANSPMDTVDQTASVTVTSFVLGSGTTSSASTCIRQPGTGTLTFYRTAWLLSSSGELNSFALIQTVANVSTTIDSDTQDGANNDIITVTASGSSITGTVNGIDIMNATDSAITTGNYGAVRTVGTHSTASVTLDNFSIADYTPPAPTFGTIKRRAS